MQYRSLGNTDINVSLIGLGTMTWGNQNDQQDGFEQMDYAISQGVNFFDTAEMYAVPPAAATYGTTETIIGNWLAQRNNRQDIILASKIAGPGLSWVRNGDTITPTTMRLALADSLKRLQTDYLDLYQLHWPNRGSYHFGKLWGFNPNFDAEQEKDNFLSVLQCLDELVKEGSIRHFGLSNETAWGVMQWLTIAEREQLPRAVSIQNEYSLLCRHFEGDLSEIALHEHCGLLAWSPLTRGMISGKYLHGARPEGARLTIETRPEHRISAHCDTAIEKYIALAHQHGLDVCQMAIAFCCQQPFVTSTLIGATNMADLKTNIAALDVTLSEQVNQGIEAIRRQYPAAF